MQSSAEFCAGNLHDHDADFLQNLSFEQVVSCPVEFVSFGLLTVLLIPVSYFLESGHFGHLCSGKCRADLVPEQLMILGKFVFRRFHFEIV